MPHRLNLKELNKANKQNKNGEMKPKQPKKQLMLNYYKTLKRLTH